MACFGSPSPPQGRPSFAPSGPAPSLRARPAAPLGWAEDAAPLGWAEENRGRPRGKAKGAGPQRGRLAERRRNSTATQRNSKVKGEDKASPFNFGVELRCRELHGAFLLQPPLGLTAPPKKISNMGGRNNGRGGEAAPGRAGITRTEARIGGNRNRRVSKPVLTPPSSHLRAVGPLARYLGRAFRVEGGLLRERE